MSGSATLELRLEIEDLYNGYVEALDDDELERWPDFFTEKCFYQVIARENFERNLPLATIRCESRGMLKDRVAAVRDTMMYEPRYLRHLVSNIRLKGEEDGVFMVRANYAVLETLWDQPTRISNAGLYLDKLVREDGRLKFAEKSCIYDSVLVPNSLIYPI